MKCPVCDFRETKVYTTKILQDGASIRRYRKCLECNFSFATREVVSDSRKRIKDSDIVKLRRSNKISRRRYSENLVSNYLRERF